MKLVPLQDKILVKRLDAEEKTKGGIILPETAKEKPQEGRIVAVGPGKIGEDGKLQPISLKKGDRIIFTSYAGSEIKVEDGEYLIMREEDVLAKVEKE